MDIFSLGCVINYVLDPGSHPFGADTERDTNILNGNSNLSRLRRCPEAQQLVRAMIDDDPRRRPSAKEALEYPLFWSDNQRLDFLSAMSDAIEYEAKNWPKDPPSDVLTKLRRLSLRGKGRAAEDARAVLQQLDETQPEPPALLALHYMERKALSNPERQQSAAGSRELNWIACLPAELVNDATQRRKYDGTSLRDCLRMLRNKAQHFGEIEPGTARRLFGSADSRAIAKLFTSCFP